MKKLNLSFLGNLSDGEKILLNQVADWVYLAENKYIAKYSFFLNEKEVSLCERLLASLKYENYMFWGGCENSKRKILCVYSRYDVISNDDFPIVPLVFRYRTADTLSHRDFLGSLMALNIARNTVGDIIVSDGCAQVFVYNTVVQLIVENVSKIGRIGVNIEKDKRINITTNDSFEEITGTVSSLRLDCILGLILRVSREKSRTIISTKEIIVNYMTVNRPDYILKENDVFSIRGYGKFLFESINGVTKKNRFHVRLKKFI